MAANSDKINNLKTSKANHIKEKKRLLSKKAENTRDRIVESAKILFAENGFLKTTVVDICRNVGLSEAALYEHFKGKEDLLLAIPDLWVSELLKDLDDQMFGVKGAFNKLRKYIWWTYRRTEEAPVDAKIVYLFLKTSSSFMETSVYQNVRLLYHYLIDIFEEGKKSGEMRQDIDSSVAQSIVIGTMDHMITLWLLKNMSYSLFEKAEETFDLLESAFSSKERS
ncbi:transcriptional regulator TetR family [Syntrophus aciditrophicus SB]|uniref:Transcriptional regulator TetR family n=1 Tax=Syntrophus aciditrophicus (strain SB) TaxID=56780 RepID=Q2LXD0_SYNAS|nr:transcriptional regulator TetR family [Syntrophus aciditrophicus SB]OPY14048.1 MAG: Fatty acid metabolism regulator protein [Syntrophus sp. PtaB.Bin075]